MSRTIIKVITLIIIILCSKNISAQTNNNYSIILQGSTGPILMSKILAKDYSYGLSAEIEWQTMGKHAWEHYFNFPSIGVGTRFMTLGNPEFLGNLFAAYPYLRFHFINSKVIKADLQTGVGLAYVTKIYSNTPHIGDDPQEIVDGMNSAMGTFLNVFFIVGLGMEVPINQAISIRADMNINHASNGNLGIPNHGVNIWNSLLGIKFSPNWNKYSAPKHTENVPDLPRNVQFELTLSGGLRNLFHNTNKMYPMASLAFAAYKPTSNWHRMGLGIDIFYSGIYSYVNYPWDYNIYTRAFIYENNLKNLFRVGVSWQNEIVIGKFVAGFHTGIYLYDNIKNLQPYLPAYMRYVNGEEQMHRPIFYKYEIKQQDGWFYGRAVAKYRFTNHLFASVGIKTNLLRADFIEWGLGYHF